jgi:hypothetical protein
MAMLTQKVVFGWFLPPTKNQGTSWYMTVRHLQIKKGKFSFKYGPLDTYGCFHQNMELL